MNASRLHRANLRLLDERLHELRELEQGCLRLQTPQGRRAAACVEVAIMCLTPAREELAEGARAR